MTAPPKPWEMGRDPGQHGIPEGTKLAHIHPRVRLSSVPPPLPSRTTHPQRRYGDSWRMGLYPNNVSYMADGFHYSGGYSGFNRRPYDFDNRFAQLAEENYQPAFQSIEAVVRSFSSVTMMLESTYQAMQMSFRAVLSVAENVSRMKSLMVQLMSNLAMMRVAHWFYKKVLYLLGIVRENPLKEDLWRAAQAKVMNGKGAQDGNVWPVVTFFALMMGGPYLMFSLLKRNGPAQGKKSRTGWDPSRDGGAQAVALYDFETEQPGELGFFKGESVLVATGPYAKEVGGWVLAAKGTTKGMAPANRLGFIDGRIMSNGQPPQSRAPSA